MDAEQLIKIVFEAVSELKELKTQIMLEAKLR